MCIRAIKAPQKAKSSRHERLFTKIHSLTTARMSHPLPPHPLLQSWPWSCLFSFFFSEAPPLQLRFLPSSSSPLPSSFWELHILLLQSSPFFLGSLGRLGGPFLIVILLGCLGSVKGASLPAKLLKQEVRCSKFQRSSMLVSAGQHKALGAWQQAGFYKFALSRTEVNDARGTVGMQQLWVQFLWGQGGTEHRLICGIIRLNGLTTAVDIRRDSALGANDLWFLLPACVWFFV